MAKKSHKAAEILDVDLNDDDQDESTTGEPRISKAEAARRTLAEGIDLPRKASVYIKDKYGLDISPQQFSAEKSRLKHRSGVASPGESHSLGSRLGAYMASSPASSGTESDVLEALETIKPLVESLGVDKVKRLVNLLG